MALLQAYQADLLRVLHITNDFSWCQNTSSLVKKAQRRLHFMRRLKKADMSKVLDDEISGQWHCVLLLLPPF